MTRNLLLPGHSEITLLGSGSLYSKSSGGHCIPAKDKYREGTTPGDLLTSYVNHEAAGTAALKCLDIDICEIKRLFVSPNFQGIGLGKLLADRVIAGAKKLGYSKMRHDNSRSVMAKAMSLYRSLGFYEIEPYNQNFVVDALSMEKTL